MQGTHASLHINRLEIMAVIHILVHLDNRTVVAFTNHQGGLRSHSLPRLANRILLRAQRNLGGKPCPQPLGLHLQWCLHHCP